jgi:drug/metabolite transporter (DMT)-like permease
MTNGTNQMRAAELRLLSVFLFAAMAACVRFAGFSAPIGQVVFFRGAFAIIPLLLYAAYKSEISSLGSGRRLGLHLRRGLVGGTALGLTFVSYVYLPLAEAISLTYLTPIFSLVISLIVLREFPAWPTVLAVIAGCCGVLLVLFEALSRGGNDDLSAVGLLCGITGALLSSFAYLIIRQLAQTEPASRIALAFAVTLMLLAAPTSLLGWSVPTATDWLYLASAGLLGGVGHIAMTEAFIRASASELAPYEYTSLVWMLLLFDVFVMSVTPSAWMLAGSALIIVSALAASSMTRRGIKAP